VALPLLTSASSFLRLKGLNSVPLTITKKFLNPPISEEAKLTAGIMGFKIHSGEGCTFNGVPLLQPHHMWALELPANSPIRTRAHLCAE